MSDTRRGTTWLVSAVLVALMTGVAASPAVAGDDGEAREIVLKPVGNKMAYETTEITAEAGAKVTVVFENTASSPAMEHNFTLLEQGASITEVGAAATKAGEDNGYIPDHDAIIANTEMAEPGETKSVTFTVPSEPGDYPYVCLFPGHYTQMQGTLHVEE